MAFSHEFIKLVSPWPRHKWILLQYKIQVKDHGK